MKTKRLKLPHNTEAEALIVKAAVESGGKKRSIYKCPNCAKYHLTSIVYPE